MKKYIFKTAIILLAFSFFQVKGQLAITVKADDYRHQYEGVGGSTGLHLGPYFQMSQEDQDAAVQLLHADLNSNFVQRYVFGDPSDPDVVAAYGNSIQFIKQSKTVRPDNKVSLIFDNYADYLRTEFITPQNDTIRILDFERPGIYDEVAQWYYDILKFFQENDIVVDILGVSNEPDHRRQYHYGHGNPQKGLAFVVKEAIPRLKTILADPFTNPTDIKLPEIMGPNTLSTRRGIEFVRFFKNEYPDAWAQLDIVSTHQYARGFLDTDIKAIAAELDGKKFYQNEMHGGRPNNPFEFDDSVSNPNKASLGTSGFFNVAINNGIQAWFNFQFTNRKNFASSSLVRARADGLAPYKQYYAFKHLTSSQPLFCHVLAFETNEVNRQEVSAFREKGNNKIYLNVSNFEGVSEQINIALTNANGENYLINSVQVTTTDESRDGEVTQIENFSDPVGNFEFSNGPHSVNTLIFEIVSETLSTTDVAKVNNQVSITNYNGDVKIHSHGDFKINQLQVFSLLGQEVLKISNADNSNEVSIPALSKGMYVIKADDLQGRSVTKKFVY